MVNQILVYEILPVSVLFLFTLDTLHWLWSLPIYELTFQSLQPFVFFKLGEALNFRVFLQDCAQQANSLICTFKSWSIKSHRKALTSTCTQSVLTSSMKVMMQRMNPNTCTKVERFLCFCELIFFMFLQLNSTSTLWVTNCRWTSTVWTRPSTSIKWRSQNSWLVVARPPMSSLPVSTWSVALREHHVSFLLNTFLYQSFNKKVSSVFMCL